MRNERLQSWWNRPSGGFTIGLLALALGLRLIYLTQVRDNPLFENPTLDAAYHLSWARQVAGGDVWGTGAFFRAPFYPYMLAVFYKLTGGDLFSIRLLQHLTGVMSIWGIYRLTRLISSEGAAKIAALAAAVYAPMMYFENELLLDFLLVPWMLLCVFAAYRVRQTQRIRWVLILGLAIGLFAVTRPNILVCVPVFGWWVWRYSIKKAGPRRRFPRIILLCAGVVIPILPVTLHNAFAGKDFVLIASQGGINFFIGNNAESDGLSAAMPKPWGHTWRLADVELHVAKQLGHPPKPSESSNFWLKKGLGWWQTEPFAAVKLTVKKAILLLSNTEIANDQNIGSFWRAYAPLTKFLPLSFGILAPLGLVGLVLLARRDPFPRFLLWVLVCYAISVVLFFVPARFRLPLLPGLFVGFGVAVATIYRRVVERTWKAAAAPITAVFLLMALSFGPWYQTRPATDAQTVFQLGNAALRQNKLDEAAGYYRQALAMQPNYPDAHLNIGVVLLRRQMTEQAATEFLAELAVSPQSAKAFANLCTVRDLQGRSAEAEEYGKRALDLDSGNTTALIGLSKTWWAKRKYRDAIELLESGPPQFKDSPLGRDALGGMYVQLGRYEQAEAFLRPLADGEVRFDQSTYGIDARTFAEELGFTRIAQHQANACYNLGWMYARKKDLARAVPYFEQAITVRPEFGEAYANLGAALIDLERPDSALACFQRAAAIDSTNAGYIFNLGIARLHLGDTTAGVYEFRRALQLKPDFQPAKQKLALLTHGS